MHSIPADRRLIVRGKTNKALRQNTRLCLLTLFVIHSIPTGEADRVPRDGKGRGQFNQGWAVLNRAGTMNVIESTITDNNGVGIGNYAGASLNVIGSTVSNNQAVFEAGGIASDGP
ncbi:MAG: hypothetical protein H0V90_14570, partial [Blastocatellia bacterium]|nr:hypothetical protein [Blastocatellia bacterium]